MSAPEIPQPHDSLIRYTLGSTENAISFFQAHLPEPLVAALAWERIRLESGSYVDEELRRSESDLLYSVPVRHADSEEEEVLIYLLFEHQSTVDPWQPLRLLGYMLAIWQRYRKENPEAKGLPLLLPMVLSQAAGGWRVSPQFADLIKWPAGLREVLSRFQPQFEHFLVDLAKQSNDELAGNVTVRLAQALLKAAAEGTLWEWIEWAEPHLPGLPSPEVMQVLFLYFINAIDEASNKDLREIAAKIDFKKTPVAADAIMSLAERIRIDAKAEGLEEGLKKGREEGRADGLLRGALIGQIETLERLLKRPETPLSQLHRMEPEQLRAMIGDLEREIQGR